MWMGRLMWIYADHVGQSLVFYSQRGSNMELDMCQKYTNAPLPLVFAKQIWQ